MKQLQPSGFNDFAGIQAEILNLFKENDFLTTEQIQTALTLPKKDVLEALKRLELSSQVRYSRGEWQRTER